MSVSKLICKTIEMKGGRDVTIFRSSLSAWGEFGGFVLP